MIKLMLNLHKFNNYAFFCPVSRLHLTVSSPVGYANEVTTAILKALKAETILDVDGVVDIETGTVKTAKEAAPKAPVQEKAPEQKSSEQKEAPAEKVEAKEEVPKQEEKPAEEKSKKGKKAKANAE